MCDRHLWNEFSLSVFTKLVIELTSQFQCLNAHFFIPSFFLKIVNNLTQCVSQRKQRVPIGNFISKLATLHGTVLRNIGIIRHMNDFQTSYTSTSLKCQRLLSKMGNFLIMLSRQLLSTNSCNTCSTNGWVHMPGVALGAVETTNWASRRYSKKINHEHNFRRCDCYNIIVTAGATTLVDTREILCKVSSSFASIQRVYTCSDSERIASTSAS